MPRPHRWIALALLLPLAAGAQVYRNVGPDGRVTYSDRPPGEAREAPVAAGATARAAASAPLPLELRSLSSRYPVTLYTGADCAPCTSGRGYLTQRGIPFSERTVATSQDVEAFQRLTGQARVPVLAVGGQRLQGYSETEWAQYLDAAGYPRESRLPRGWRPAVAPLAPVTVTEAPAPAVAEEVRAAPPLPLPRDPGNAAGIRF